MRRFGSFIFLISVVFFSSPLWASEKEISIYWSALDQLGKENFSVGVKKYYKFIITSEPLLSVPCRKMDLSKASRYFSDKLKQNPEDPKSVFSMGLISRILHQWPEAEEKIDKLRKKAPSSALLIFIRGEFYLQRRLEEEAKKAFAALAKNPLAKNFFFLAKMLLARSGIGEDSKSEDRKKSLLRIAFRHFDLMEYSQAEEILLQVRKEYPEDQESPKVLMQMYMERQKFKEADRILEEWARNHQKSLITPVQEARLRYFQQKYDKVVPLLKKISFDDPANECLRLMYAESLFVTKAYSEAIPHFQKLKEKDPDDPGLFNRLVTCLEQTGKTGETLEEYRKYIETHPKEIVFTLEYIAWLERTNELDKAEEQLKKITDTESPYKEYIAGKLEDLQEYRLKKEEAKVEAAKEKIEVSTAFDEKQPPVSNSPVVTSTVGKSVLGSKSKNELALLKSLYGN